MAIDSVAVIGAGKVGRCLSTKWAERGLPVVLGSRNRPEGIDGVKLATITEGIASSDVVVLALTGSALGPFLEENAAALAHKTVIDATNNLLGPPVGRVIAEKLHQRELFERLVPTATWCRAFNTVSVEMMTVAGTRGRDVFDLFYCSPDETRPDVEALIDALGFRPVLLGGQEEADNLDGITRAYFTLMIARGHGKHVAFGLVADSQSRS